MVCCVEKEHLPYTNSLSTLYSFRRFDSRATDVYPANEMSET